MALYVNMVAMSGDYYHDGSRDFWHYPDRRTLSAGEARTRELIAVEEGNEQAAAYWQGYADAAQRAERGR